MTEISNSPPNKPNNTTPWTTGPWVAAPLRSLRQHGMVRHSAHFDTTQDQYRAFDISTHDADAHLIALAPEMAEAILGWFQRMDEDYAFDGPQEVWHPNVRALWGMAAKLRAIGGPDA